MKTEYSHFKRHLETAVNISLILLALTLVVILGKNYLFPDNSSKTLAKGDRLSFSNGKFENRPKTLLLFLRSGCEFCSNSAPFYKQILSETATLADVKIAAVFSEKDAKAEAYLQGLGLGDVELRRIDFVVAGVTGTPTVVLIDEKGVVKEFWRGFLSPRKRVELKQQLGLPASTDFLVKREELEKLKESQPELIILDVRDRESFAKGHAAGAKNIPLDELSVRAINELNPETPVILSADDDADTDTAYDILAKNSSNKVYILLSPL